MSPLGYPFVMIDAALGGLGLLFMVAALLRPGLRRWPLLLALAWAALGRGFIAYDVPLVVAVLMGLFGGSWVAWQLWGGIRGRASSLSGLATAPFVLAIVLCWMAPMASQSTLERSTASHGDVIRASVATPEPITLAELRADPSRARFGGPPLDITDAVCGAGVRWWVTTKRRMGGHRKIKEKSTVEYTRLGDSRFFVAGHCEGPVNASVIRVDPHSGLAAQSGVAEPIALQPVPSIAALNDHLALTRWIHLALPGMVLLSLLFQGARRAGDAGLSP